MQINNKTFIHSVATAVPPNRIDQQMHHSILDSANGLNRMERLMLRTIYRNSGINSRYSVLKEFGEEDKTENAIFHPAGNSAPVPISFRMELFDRFASPLAAEAGEKAIEESGFTKSEITHLIVFSCTGMSAPGLDIQLTELLGLKTTIERICIHFMGCYAAINALKTARSIAAADPDAIILVAGVELCTLHYQRIIEQDQLVANALFADGAAAVIVSSKTPANGMSFVNFFSDFQSAGKNDMIWKIGQFGFDIRLSSYVPDLVESNIGKLVESLYNKSGIKREDIDYFAIHPGGVKILEATENALGISKADNRNSYAVLNDFGNMSSVTVLFVLEKIMRNEELEKGQHILSCAFGPGLTIESMLLEVYA